jgi:hypothetical protein
MPEIEDAEEAKTTYCRSQKVQQTAASSAGSGCPAGRVVVEGQLGLG